MLVLDDLNTHKLVSRDGRSNPNGWAGWPSRSRCITPPKHGSWLNVAEIELSVLSRQCLDQRIDSADELRKELEPWQVACNDRQVGVIWRFTTTDARIKLKRL